MKQTTIVYRCDNPKCRKQFRRIGAKRRATTCSIACQQAVQRIFWKFD